MLRRLLATLLCRPNRPVDLDSLIAALWQDDPPRTAYKTLSIYVHRLRKVLGSARLAVVDGVGYRLHVDEHELDAAEFAALAADSAVARDRGDIEEASSLAEQALALWRGPAFAGIDDNDVVCLEGTRLEEMRLATTEGWAETELALGRYNKVIGELLALVAGNPYRERLTGMLMLALYHGGRQAESLEVYQNTFRLLRSELGVRPGPELQRLHQRILQEDPDLLSAQRPVAAVQVRVRDTLPHDLPAFTGRTPELDRLRQVLGDGQHHGDAVVISAIEGMAGVGKTQLAIHIAHLLVGQEAFERVLFVNLRGFHPAQPPVDPAAVLDGFLRLLGVPDQQVPHDLPARTAAYRARLAGTQTLVMLDNAADAEQVHPLLAATAGCLTLVTSRRRLTGLRPTIQLTVDVFSPQEALAFLTRATSGVPVGADPQAPARIAQRCGHLPLALSLAAGHIRSTPDWTLTDHADRLDERHQDRRLDAGVEVALDLSYQHLPAAEQRLLRMAALHPGQDFDVYAAAALAGTALPAVQDYLDHLCRDHLLQQAAPGRYSFHDLVRAYAADRSKDQEPPPQRRAALTRLLDYYSATAAAAMNTAEPHGRQHHSAASPVHTPTPSMADRNVANCWLDTELANLLTTAQHAAGHGWSEHVWRLSAILDRHLRTRGRYREAETLHQLALNLADQFGNHHAEMNALSGLGHVCWRLGRHEQAGDHFVRALQIAQDIGDRVGELDSLQGLGHAHRRQGHHRQAGDHFTRALQIAQDIGDRVGELHALAGLGDVHVSHSQALQVAQDIGDRFGERYPLTGPRYVHWILGRYEQAAVHFERALQIAQDIGDPLGERGALTGLGSIHWVQGRYEQADDQFGRALQIAQATGDRSGELRALIGLADVHRMLGRHEQAANCYQRVLDLAGVSGGGNWQFEALLGLGRLHHGTGHPDIALIHHGQALQYATGLAQPADQARAYDGLAHAHHTLNHHDQARQHWQHAMNILTSLSTDHTDDFQPAFPTSKPASPTSTGSLHADVADGTGAIDECGHRKPEELDSQWEAKADGSWRSAGSS